MSDSTSELWVNTSFHGRQVAAFLAVKEYLGLKTNSEVVRHLVHIQARALRRNEQSRTMPVREDRAAAAEGSTSAVLGLPAANLPGRGDDESLCLTCPLPECDDGDPRCAYQEATGERDRQRGRASAYLRRRRNGQY